jgi:hypothetical protein
MCVRAICHTIEQTKFLQMANHNRAAKIQQHRTISRDFCEDTNKEDTEETIRHAAQRDRTSLYHTFSFVFFFSSRSFLSQLIAPAFSFFVHCFPKDLLHFCAFGLITGLALFLSYTCEHSWIPFYADIKFYFYQSHFV